MWPAGPRFAPRAPRSPSPAAARFPTSVRPPWQVWKSNRPFVLRAYGRWPAEASLTTHSAEPARVVRLPAAAWRATAAHNGVGALLNALQALALIAAVSNRTPVIPRVPCDSLWLARSDVALAGVADDYVLQLRGAGGHLECHLALGGPHCDVPLVLPAWDASASSLAARADEVEAATVVAAFDESARDDCAPPPAQCSPADCAGVRRLALDVRALRRAMRAAADAAVVEVAPSRRSLLGCSTAVELDVVALTAEEEARWRLLKKACPGFYATSRAR